MKNLKVATFVPFYKNFIKGQVEGIAKYVSRVDVYLHYNVLSEISRLPVPIQYFRYVRRFTKGNIIDNTSTPKNVKVNIISSFYLIPDGSNPFVGERLCRKFFNYVANRDYDILHAHIPWPQGFVAMKISKDTDVPYVVTVHGINEISDIINNSRNFLQQKIKGKVITVLNEADHIITVSYKNKKLLVDALGDHLNNKITVIPNGFDKELFRPIPQEYARKMLGLPQNKQIILNVAYLEPIKGHDFLLKALSIVRNSGKDFLCIVIGDGSQRRYLERLATRLGISDKMIFLGERPHSEIPLWMNAADLFVLPSLSEGNPTVMFEALGVGLPFVGTRVGGVPEIITSEDYGLLCEPKNPEDLAEKILISLGKEWDREKIRKYAEQFTWEKVARQVVDIYKKLLTR